MASPREEAREAAIAEGDAEIAELRARLLWTLQQHQQPQQDEIQQQQPQQDEIQQQQQQQYEIQQDEIQQHHQQQDETTSTDSTTSCTVDAAVAAPTWTLNAMGVPVSVAKPDDGVAVDAPSAAAVGGDGSDEEYAQTKDMPSKWARRYDLLADVVLRYGAERRDSDAARARKLARLAYAGPELGYI